MKTQAILRAACAALLTLIGTSCSGMKPGSTMAASEQRFLAPHPAVAKPATPPPGQGGDYSPPIKDFGRGQFWARMDDRQPFRTIIVHEGKTFTCDVARGGNVIWHPGKGGSIRTISQNRVPGPVVVQANEDIRTANSGRECAPLTKEEEMWAWALMGAFSSRQMHNGELSKADLRQ